MKTYRKASEFLVVFAIIAMTLLGCNKKDAQNNLTPTNNQSTKKPIATYNLLTGSITYSIDVEELTEVFNTITKTDQRYIIENFELEPNSIPRDDSLYSALKIVVIDTDDEVTYTHWLYGGFLETILNNNNLDFYLAEDICDGNYIFIAPGDKENRLVTVQNGSLFSSEQIDNPELYAPIFPWDLTCTTGPRCSDCSKDFWKVGFHCNCVNGYSPDAGYYCQSSSGIGGSLAIVGIVLAIIAII